MKTFAILLITGISPLNYPMDNAKSEVLGFLFNAVDEMGREYGVTFGFFRGEFLTFSLKATLVGMIYYDRNYTDYEAKPFVKGIKMEGDTIWYKDSFIKRVDDGFEVNVRTRNYEMQFKVFYEENLCEKVMKSSFDGEFYLPIMPAFMKGTFSHGEGFRANVSGRGFVVHLWADSSLRLKDYLLFNAEEVSGFFEIDVKDGVARGLLCEKENIKESEFSFKIAEKGRGTLTDRLYPIKGVLGEDEIVFNVRATSDEIKIVKYSYLLSPVKVKVGEEEGYGFFISHPLKEEKRREVWEF